MAKPSKKTLAHRFSKRRGSRRTMRGGWRVLSGAALNDTTMSGPTNASLKQGEEYSVMHEGQHGGGGLSGAPAFQSETLPSSMVTAARTGETLQAFQEIRGMKDQGGGGKKRRGRGRRRFQKGGFTMEEEEETMAGGNSNTNAEVEEEETMAGGRRSRRSRSSRRSRGSRRSRRSRRRNYRQGGGSHVQPADVSAPSMLLSGNSAKHAEGGMNPEWQLAKNPASFAPN